MNSVVDVNFARETRIHRACYNGTGADLKRGTPVFWDRSQTNGMGVKLPDGTNWLADFAGVLEKDVADGKYAANALVIGGMVQVNYTGHASAAAGTWAIPVDNARYFTYSANKTPFVLQTSMIADTDEHLVEVDGSDAPWVWIEPPRSGLFVAQFNLGAPAAGVAEDTVANAICTSSATTVATIAAQPDVARRLIVDMNSSATLADVSSGVIAVVGTNIHGEALSENVQQVANSSGPWTTTGAYKTITSITFPAQDGAGAAFEVKRSDAIGLPFTQATNRIIQTSLDNAAESTQPTVTVDDDEVEKNTIDTSTAYNGSKVVRVIAAL